MRDSMVIVISKLISISIDKGRVVFGKIFTGSKFLSVWKREKL